MKNSILILEDSLIIQGVYKIYLSTESFSLHFVKNGSEGMEYLSDLVMDESNFPDLIITDLEMPIMSGTEFINKLKKYPPIPLLICSGLAPTPTTLGLCRGYLQKPFGPTELLTSIRKFIT